MSDFFENCIKSCARLERKSQESLRLNIFLHKITVRNVEGGFPFPALLGLKATD